MTIEDKDNHETNEVVENDHVEEEEEAVNSKADESNAMKKLQAVVEEKSLDTNKMKIALDDLRQKEEESLKAEKQREKELAAISVNKDEVSLLVDEFELAYNVADRKLREAGGDVVKCIKLLVNSPSISTNKPAMINFSSTLFD